MPRRRRRRAASLLVGVLTVALAAGCAVPDGAARTAGGRDATGERLVVVATFTVLADIVAQVGGPHVSTTSITGPGMNVHGYEPTPDDLRRAADADLVVASGLGLEVWLHDLVDPLRVPTVVVGDRIEPLPVHGTARELGGLVHNPHAWMSPRAGRAYVGAVAGALQEVDPANAADYAARAAELEDGLAELEERLSSGLAALPPGRRTLVTCEGAFSYLARDAGLTEAYLWPVNAERQGTPRQVARVIDTVRAGDVPAVFCEWTVSPTAQRQVARESGAVFAGELYVDSLTGPEGPVPTYLDLLGYDIDLILEGLSGASAGQDA